MLLQEEICISLSSYTQRRDRDELASQSHTLLSCERAWFHKASDELDLLCMRVATPPASVRRGLVYVQPVIA